MERVRVTEFSELLKGKLKAWRERPNNPDCLRDFDHAIRRIYFSGLGFEIQFPVPDFLLDDAIPQ